MGRDFLTCPKDTQRSVSLTLVATNMPATAAIFVPILIKQENAFSRLSILLTSAARGTTPENLAIRK